MKLRLEALLIVAAVSILGSGGQGLAAPAKSYVDAIFDRGETLTFSLAWLRVVGGEARMTVVPSANGEQLTISSVAESTGVLSRLYRVRDQIETVVDRRTFSTLRFQKSLNERNRIKEEVTTIDVARKVATRKGKEIEIPSPIFDPLSLIFYIRKLDLTPGRRHFFNVIADGKVYTLESEVLRRETIGTDAGTFRAIVVEPKMRAGGIFRDENNRLLIWYSDDDRRLPVRIRSDIPAGSITASLRSYTVGLPVPARTASKK